MILTRCSYCGTAFRVTPEQLRIRNGQVRCGHCEAVFNALDFLEEEEDIESLLEKSFSNHIPAVPVPTLEPVQANPAALGYTATGLPADHPGGLAAPVRRRNPSAFPATDGLNESATTWGNQRPDLAPPSEGLAQFVQPKPKAANWPYFLLALPLALLLAGQLLYAYRTPLTSQYAFLGGLFQVAGIEVPLPKQSELLAIESTDLQADVPNQQLILLGTLRNQAPFNQAWPSLELSLMDTANTLLSRRVLFPQDYLSADAPPVMAARSELALRLRLSAEGLSPANYRLYVFYP